jgi:translation initiation factor IF-1
MAKQSAEQDGSIIEALSNAVPCRVRKWTYVIAHISGKMRMHYIKLLPGDKVKRNEPIRFVKSKLLIDIKDIHNES